MQYKHPHLESPDFYGTSVFTQNSANCKIYHIVSSAHRITNALIWFTIEDLDLVL